MTKIDVFMYDLSTIIEEWRNLPLGRDTPKYYDKIIKYVGKDIIAEFLSRLNWICERVEFHTENPDSELMDELIEEYHKWEEK